MTQTALFGFIGLMLVLAVIRTAITISRMRRAPRQVSSGNFWTGCAVGVLIGVLVMAAIMTIYPLLALRFK